MSVHYKRGFSLVELLVVIAIIAVLSVSGLVLFTNAQKAGRDAKRRQDIDTISKAYEVKYSTNLQYSQLSSSDFSSGNIPKDPRNVDYFNVLVTESGKGTAYKVCAALDNNPFSQCNTPATNCYCKPSQLSSAIDTSFSNLSGSGASLGWGGTQPSSCDPNGTLAANLVGYWKLDDGSGTLARDSSGNGNNLTLANGPVFVSGAQAKSVGAISFSGTTQWAHRATGNNLPLGNSARTLTAWVNPTGLYNDVTYNGIVAYGGGCLFKWNAFILKKQ